MTMELSIGLGRDLHTLSAGFPLVLGGVSIKSAKGFNTHSDGDVLSHAIVDALAGAIAEGDLGTWFPEDDPEAVDAKSLNFVYQMASTVTEKGYEILHLDSFVTLGPVKLRPYLQQMRQNIAEAIQIPIEHVSVKARSNDGQGLEGRGEACSAQAIVLLNKIS